MYLVDDKHSIAPVGRGHLHLVLQRAYILDAVIARGIKLNDIQRAVFVELPARFALVARLAVGGTVGAVDCFGKDSRTRGFADTSRAAKQICVS